MQDCSEILNQTYSFDDCLEEAKKYNNAKEWKENGQSYLHALNKDWVKEIVERVGYNKNGRGRKWWYKIG